MIRSCGTSCLVAGWSVRGTCHGVWLIYPVKFHNLVLFIHDGNTNFFKEDTIAIMLKVTFKKTCPGGETCRGVPAVQQVDPLYSSSSLTSTALSHLTGPQGRP